MTKVKLKKDATCPNCMGRFKPEDALWIAVHQSLAGDRKLPKEFEMMRFLPSRFSPDGFAIDPKGIECKKLACPLCHLEIPRCVLDTKSLFFSILGTRGSGKSFFLASMTHELRRVMKETFNIKFFDPDPTFNKTLLTNEDKIFYNKTPSDMVNLVDLVDKTQHLHEGLFNQVLVSGQVVNYAKPFIFQADPIQDNDQLSIHRRLVTLFDNSGESFELGKDNDAELVTLHMAEADALFYVIDPTQYPGIKEQAEKTRLGSMEANRDYTDSRQELILTESVSRIGRYRGVSASAKYDKPVFVILTKWDSWCHMTPEISPVDPYIPIPGKSIKAISFEKIKAASKVMKKFLKQHAPNIVNTCESFAQSVVYIPVSSLGKTPVKDKGTSMNLIRPGEIQPTWVTVPLAIALAITTKGLVTLAEPEKPGT